MKAYFTSSLGRVHYAEAGDGPAMLMLHSTPRSHRQFHDLQPLLAGSFRTLAPDTLGFGASDRLPPQVAFDALADGLVELLDERGIVRTHVYGFHTGNKIAAALAARHPERVDHLVLSGQTHSLIPDKTKRDDAIRLLVQKYFTAADAPADDPQALMRRWAADFGLISQSWWGSDLLKHGAAGAAVYAAHQRYVADLILCRDSIVNIYRANFAFDFGAALAAIVAPALVIEFATPAEEHLGRQAAPAAKALASGHGITLENTGGGVHDEKSDVLFRLIADFCTS